jgi:hypothetical protein
MVGALAKPVVSLEAGEKTSTRPLNNNSEWGSHLLNNSRKQGMGLNGQPSTYPVDNGPGSCAQPSLPMTPPVLPLQKFLDPASPSMSTDATATHDIPPNSSMPPSPHGSCFTDFPRSQPPCHPQQITAFTSLMSMADDRDRGYDHPCSDLPLQDAPKAPSRADGRRSMTVNGNNKVMFVVASLFELNIGKKHGEAGHPYLSYVPGEMFDVCFPLHIAQQPKLTGIP